MATERAPAGPRYTAAGAVLHQLLREAERLARADLGAPRLSSARIALLQSLRRRPKTVSSLARERDASRQSVQRIANSMANEGWIESAPNPRDGRAPLLGLTSHGARILESASAAQASVLSRLAERFGLDELSSALRVLRALRAD
jgi:DNA-binding MarR family transcriptional regulator